MIIQNKKKTVLIEKERDVSVKKREMYQLKKTRDVRKNNGIYKNMDKEDEEEN